MSWGFLGFFCFLLQLPTSQEEKERSLMTLRGGSTKPPTGGSWGNVRVPVQGEGMTPSCD